MNIIKAYIRVPKIDGQKILKGIEQRGRICYKSEDKIKDGSKESFCNMIVNDVKHLSVIEHANIGVVFVTNRGVTHELVRHRIGSYSQESTRYCNYQKEKFGKEISVIKPNFLEGSSVYSFWEKGCKSAEIAYFSMLDAGATAQEAREVLPNSLKTEIAVSFNLREWIHFFDLRAAKPAHPMIKQIAIPLLIHFKEQIPVIFDNVKFDEDYPEEHYAEIIIDDDLLLI